MNKNNIRPNKYNFRENPRTKKSLYKRSAILFFTKTIAYQISSMPPLVVYGSAKLVRGDQINAEFLESFRTFSCNSIARGKVGGETLRAHQHTL